MAFLSLGRHHTLSFGCHLYYKFWWLGNPDPEYHIPHWGMWYSHFCVCVCASGHFFLGIYWKEQSIFLSIETVIEKVWTVFVRNSFHKLISCKISIWFLGWYLLVWMKKKQTDVAIRGVTQLQCKRGLPDGIVTKLWTFSIALSSFCEMLLTTPFLI